jgi:ABC-2 type transport system permease protein
VRWHLAALAACRVHLQVRVVSPMTWLGVVFQPAIFAAIGIALFGTASRAQLAYSVLGGGLVGLWGNLLVNASFDIQQERAQGTLEQLLGAPAPLSAVVAGKVLASTLPGLASFGMTAVVAFAAVHALPDFASPAFVASMVLTFAAFYSLGLILAPVFALIRMAPGFLNALEVPMYLLCGFMFPVSQLPLWVVPISYLLAPRWSILALYSAESAAASDAPYALYWGATLALIALDVALAWLLLRAVEHRWQVTGDLTVV